MLKASQRLESMRRKARELAVARYRSERALADWLVILEAISTLGAAVR
jgi:hypothetical protein